MASPAIEARGLGKRYRLGQTGYATLRETVTLRRRDDTAGTETREIWALRNLDLSIGEGDVVGIVGRNGAGKTTFLKTVARIVRPTTGLVRVRGRVGALLEVGTGFHPELTGRENVYLNGVVLGMTRREIDRRFDDIVTFAGVERFLDTPLKRYSSGMYLRLAFAVAAHIDPDVVIVDEVLAVGDAEFQRRCLGRMSEFGREGRTVLFVSHDTGAVGRLCRRAIWLDGGELRDDGPVHDVLAHYLATTAPTAHRAEAPGRPNTPIGRVSLAIVDPHGVSVAAPRRDEPLTLHLVICTTERLLSLDAAVYLLDADGVQVLSENISDTGSTIGGPPQELSLHLTIPPVLSAGDYTVGVWLGTESETVFYQELLTFTMLPRFDERADAIRRRRIVQPPVTWTVESTHSGSP
jgi:ABC-2 type transport system ATP-binding protein/lipopolysaccharide transport system ATP-binding protein